MNLHTFDLNLLRVLDALLREGSTVRAAERIGLSQPAVSAALGRLRHALGDPLFLRQGQRLIPTPYAETLAAPVAELMEQIARTLSGPSHFDPMREARTFRITATDFFAEMLMPDLAAALMDRAPGVRIQLVELLPNRYLEPLETGDADIALFPDNAAPGWIERRPAFWSPFVAIARTGHPAIDAQAVDPGQPIPIDLFCALGHVLMSTDGRFSAMGDAALARAGRKRRVVMTLPVFSGVMRAVAESDLISLVPQQIAERLGPQMGLTLYAPPVEPPCPLISAYWHRRLVGDPGHRWFRGEVMRHLARLNRGQPALPEPASS